MANTRDHSNLESSARREDVAVPLNQAEIQALSRGLSMSWPLAQEFGGHHEEAWHSARDKLAEASRILQAVAGDDSTPEPEFQFGRASLNERGFDCCGKPQGCTNMNPGCAYLQHPYKRWVRGEITLAELNERTAK